MKKTILVLSLMAGSFSAQAKDTCKHKLEQVALAAFEATEFRVADMPVVARVNMMPKYKEVTIFQYKARYKMFIQLRNEDAKLCDVVGMTPIKEVR